MSSSSQLTASDLARRHLIGIVKETAEDFSSSKDINSALHHAITFCKLLFPQGAMRSLLEESCSESPKKGGKDGQSLGGIQLWAIKTRDEARTLVDSNNATLLGRCLDLKGAETRQHYGSWLLSLVENENVGELSSFLRDGDTADRCFGVEDTIHAYLLKACQRCHHWSSAARPPWAEVELLLHVATIYERVLLCCKAAEDLKELPAESKKV